MTKGQSLARLLLALTLLIVPVGAGAGIVTFYDELGRLRAIGVLPGCSQAPGSPDGALPTPPGWSPGTTPIPYGPWHKFRGKAPTPENDIVTDRDGTVICANGSCAMPGGHTILLGPPDRGWVPPINPRPIPGVEPLPKDICSRSKSPNPDYRG